MKNLEDSLPDAVSSAELVGTHVKDQTGLGGPNSLKLVHVASYIQGYRRHGMPQAGIEFREFDFDQFTVDRVVV